MQSVLDTHFHMWSNKPWAVKNYWVVQLLFTLLLLSWRLGTVFSLKSVYLQLENHVVGSPGREEDYRAFSVLYVNLVQRKTLALEIMWTGTKTKSCNQRKQQSHWHSICVTAARHSTVSHSIKEAVNQSLNAASLCHLVVTHQHWTILVELYTHKNGTMLLIKLGPNSYRN